MTAGHGKKKTPQFTSFGDSHWLKLTVASIKMERRKTPQLKQKLINDRPMNGTELNLVELSII